jgi:adenylate kinase family enzyme
MPDPRYSRAVADGILVYGVTGSGKTALAERISALTGIPCHAVDELTWEPGWVQVPDDEQRRRIEAICASGQWILDTAYGKWLDVPLARADLIVALDFPRWLSLARLIRRTVARVLDGRAVCNGNRESLRHVFSPDSIILWHFRSFRRKRSRIRSWEADSTRPVVVRLTSPRAVEEWLGRLGAAVP